MKYTVKADNNSVEVMEMLFEESEQQNLKTAIENMARGTAAAMLEFVQEFSDSEEKTKLIFDALLDYISMISENIFEESTSMAEISEEVDFKAYEDLFITWIYEQGYDDAYAFADEHGDKNPELDFAVEGDTAFVYISAGGERLNDIGEIQAYLFEDEPGMAKQMCVEFTSIAVLALDKVYGIENNPLRRVSAYDLESRIKEKLL